MEPRFFDSIVNQKYISLWSKYRPVILQLMLASEEEPQQYKLFGHEFKALNQKAKVFSFKLQAYQGKAINDIRSSAPASDLLYILNNSRKASELMDEASYEFALDKQFMLHVTRLETAE